MVEFVFFKGNLKAPLVCSRGAGAGRGRTESRRTVSVDSIDPVCSLLERTPSRRVFVLASCVSSNAG